MMTNLVVDSFAYKEAWCEVMSRMDPPRHLLAEDILEKQQEYGLDRMERFISIGPAGGDLDVAVLRAFPKCRQYIGIEPDNSNSAALVDTLKENHPHLELDLHNCKAEQWKGPDDLVDVVFLSHVLYFIDDQKSFLDRVVTWIKPGGYIITVADNEKEKWTTFMMKYSPDAFGKLVGYNNSNLRADLEKLPNTDIVWEIHKSHVFDIRNPNALLAACLLQRKYTQEEAENLFKDLEQYEPSGLLPSGCTITFVKKH